VLQTPLSLLRRLPGTVLLLVAGTLINKLGSFILPYLTLVLKRAFHLSGIQVGALVAAYGIGSIVSILTGGVLTDRLGRRRTLLVSLLGSGVLAVAMGFAPSLSVFVPLLVLFGFVADLYRPAAAAIVSDVLPSRDRALGYAALRLAVNLGFAGGMAIGGLLADRSWRLLFVGDGATTLVYGGIVLALIGETRPRAGSGEQRHGPVSLAKDRVFLQLTISSLLFCTAIFVDLTVLPLTITLSAGYPAWVYGLLVGTNGLLIAAFELPLVEWLRRFRRLRVAALGIALSGIGFGITGMVMHWTWFLLAVLFWTAGEMLVVPQQNAFIADWAPPEARGRYLGAYHATWSLGLTIAPLIFLPLHARLSEGRFWPLLVLPAIPAALLVLHLDRTADRRELLRGLMEETRTEEVLAAAIASEAEGAV
jgi:MFS family permease